MGQLSVDSQTVPRPLDSFPILRSRNIEEVREALFRFNGSRLKLPRRAADFDFKVNYWPSRKYWAVILDFRRPVSIGDS